MLKNLQQLFDQKHLGKLKVKLFDVEIVCNLRPVDQGAGAVFQLGRRDA